MQNKESINKEIIYTIKKIVHLGNNLNEFNKNKIITLIVINTIYLNQLLKYRIR